MNVEMIVNKVYGTDKAKKKLIIEIMEKIENTFPEVKELNSTEKILLTLNLVGLEKQIQNIFMKKISNDQMNKIKTLEKIVNHKRVV